MTPENETLGARLRRLREAKGLSQRDLALSAGVTQAQVSRIEADEREPVAGTLFALARALDASLGDFDGLSRGGTGA